MKGKNEDSRSLHHTQLCSYHPVSRLANNGLSYTIHLYSNESNFFLVIKAFLELFQHSWTEPAKCIRSLPLHYRVFSFRGYLWPFKSKHFAPELRWRGTFPVTWGHQAISLIYISIFIQLEPWRFFQDLHKLMYDPLEICQVEANQKYSKIIDYYPENEMFFLFFFHSGILALIVTGVFMFLYPLFI